MNARSSTGSHYSPNAGWLFIALSLAITAIWAMAWYYGDGETRFPGYGIDETWKSEADGPLLVGAAAVPITPVLKDGENVWLAGFSEARMASGVHDDLWARAVAFGYEDRMVVICSVDLIGLFYSQVIAIRKLLPPDVSHVHLIVAATHNHEGPDTMGLWGSGRFASGTDEEYLALLRTRVLAAVVTAVRTASAAKMIAASGRAGVDGLVHDIRPPRVIDDELSIIRFASKSTDSTIATIVAWSNHPETLGGKNTLITSDYPNMLRLGVEGGMANRWPGNGGVCVYVNGSIGGLMTPLGVEMNVMGETIKKPSFERADALGERVASKAVALIANTRARPEVRPPLSLRAKTIYVPLHNTWFRLAAKLGVVDRGFVDSKIRTEISGVSLGSVDFLAIPGEIHPEIVIGGIENPPGANFEIEPVEVPPLKRRMMGKINVVIGLANDELGYIIPKSEWDEAYPNLYMSKESSYGEVNSLGPETGPTIYRAAMSVLEELREVSSVQAPDGR